MQSGMVIMTYRKLWKALIYATITPKINWSNLEKVYKQWGCSVMELLWEMDIKNLTVHSISTTKLALEKKKENDVTS